MKKALPVTLKNLCAAAAYVFLFCGRAAAQDSVQKEYFCDDIKKPFFASDGKAEFYARRRTASPEKFLMPKPAGVRRVFVAGESVAGILGMGKSVLGKDIPGGWFSGGGSKAAKGGGNAGFEIINCGMGGYESYRIYGVIKEVLDYSPDLLVVLSGNNEGVSESCPGLEFELRRRELRLLERYYTLKYGPQEAKKKASLKMHENMLVKMARAAKKAGVPIVFCTLPANVRDMPPRVPLPLEDGLFASGYRLFYDKKYSAAFEKFRLGLAARPHDYFLNFYMGKTLEKLGRSGEAGAYLLKASDFNEAFLGSVRERNGLVREAAGSGGACVADLGKFFAGISSGGLPGWAEFTDSMHWRPSYNKAVWEEIFRSAGACGVKGFEKIAIINPAQLAETPRTDALKRLSYAFFWMDEHELNEGALAELSYIREKDPELLGEGAVSPERLGKLLIHNFWSFGAELRIKSFFPLFLAHLAETERRFKNYPAALELCARALVLEPGNAYFRFERAQVLAGLGKKKEAESEFAALAPALFPKDGGNPRQAWGGVRLRVNLPERVPPNCGAGAADLKLRDKARALGLAYGFNMPAPPETRVLKKSPEEHPFEKDIERSKKLSDSAVEKMRSGDFNAAEKLLTEALGVNPSNPEALISLCSIRLRAGKKEQALQACQEASGAVYANRENNLPGFEVLACEAEFESYKILAALGRKAEAKEALGRAVKNAPASWPGLAEAKTALNNLKR